VALTQVKIVATIGGKLKSLGPFDYPNERVDQVLEAVKRGGTSTQKGVPAPDARLWVCDE
jgi:hypothetical protein